MDNVQLNNQFPRSVHKFSTTNEFHFPSFLSLTVNLSLALTYCNFFQFAELLVMPVATSETNTFDIY